MGGLREGERAAAFVVCEERELREEVREEARSGLERANLNLKCSATQYGAAQASAAPPCMASH
jgi:hypothetical protein